MTLDFWRNVAVIWLCFQGFFLLLIPLAIAYLLVRGMGWVLRKVPPLFHKAQGYSAQMRNRSEAVAGKAAQPLINAHAKARQAETIVTALFRQAEEPPRTAPGPPPAAPPVVRTAGGVTVVRQE